MLHPFPMKKHLLLISLCLPLFASAQEDPVKYMRFLPLGEVPTHEEQIVNGVRVHAEYPPGAVPPTDVSIATSGTDFESHNLRLGQYTKAIKIKKSAAGIKMTEGKTPGGKEFIMTNLMPAKDYTLGVLYRDNADMTWLKPKLMVLPEDPASFPSGQIRFVNTSPYEVAVKLGDEQPFAVAPGKSEYKTLKVGETLAVIAVKNAAGAFKRILNNNITMRPNQRVQAFFYKAQGDNPKQPVKLMIRPETYQSPTGRR